MPGALKEAGVSARGHRRRAASYRRKLVARGPSIACSARERVRTARGSPIAGGTRSGSGGLRCIASFSRTSSFTGKVQWKK